MDHICIHSKLGFEWVFAVAGFCFGVRKAKLNSFKIGRLHVKLSTVQRVPSVRGWCWKTGTAGPTFFLTSQSKLTTTTGESLESHFTASSKQSCEVSLTNYRTGPTPSTR